MLIKQQAILTVKFSGKNKHAVDQQYVSWKGIDDRIYVISADYLSSQRVRQQSPNILKKISLGKISTTLTVTYRRGP